MKFGHDTEIFAEKDGELFPLCDHFRASKASPIMLPAGSIMEDCCSLEFAPNPCESKEEWVDKSLDLLETVEEMIHSVGAEPVIRPAVEFREEVLQRAGYKAIESGCDPDWNLYTSMENKYPDLRTTHVRTGSGHIHFDAKDDPELVVRTIEWMDIVVKIPQILAFGFSERDSVQGGLGNYRPKPYGGEYRSSSNCIVLTESTLETTWENAVLAAQRAQYDPPNIPKEELLTAFNERDADTLKDMADQYGYYAYS